MTSCPDCPDLAGDRMPPGWKPRATCCRDDHIARRLAGSGEGWHGVEAAREAADKLNRRERRQQVAQARRK